MKIALFGGAFDPPHIGHKVVADSLIQNKIVDEVWFVPVFKHPWADRYGKQQLTDYDARVKMLNLTAESIKNSKKIKVEHFKEVSFTYDTLKYFSERLPQHEFCWVMGSEYLDRFDDFLKGHPRLIDFTFYIYPRAGYQLNESLRKPNMIFLTDMPEVTASSTEIRKLIKEKQPVKKLLLSSVLKFIQENNLYF
ncbi:MAG: nicotinate-nucleotide adenylyltransferase [Patescibacteria group bacterium]|nr:MAG: nicotinate-nucleotide adenylyltransferase [Patescibacteria group bacterium]